MTAENNNTLIIEPAGGLANRMMAILSSMRLAELSDRKLYINWKRTRSCHASWEDLFTNLFPLISDDEITPETKKFRVHGRSIEDKSGKLQTVPPDNPTIPIFDSSLENIYIRACGMLSCPTDPKRDHPYICYDSWVSELSTLFNKLEPTNDAKPSEILCEEFCSKPFIGLHIRRPFVEVGDPLFKSEKRFLLPSLDSYKEFIESEVGKSPNSSVFLCSNDMKTELHMKSTYQEKLLTNQKTTTNNMKDFQAIQQALQDIILLSKCETIIGADTSSFSYLASVIGNKRLISLPHEQPISPGKVKFQTF